MRFLFLAFVFAAGCTTILGIDGDYGPLGEGGAGAAAGAGGTSTGDGGGATGGGGVLFPPGTLGGSCVDTSDCMEGECCTDDACANTCMQPCNGGGNCPGSSGKICEHGYCLFTCSVDADCEQPDFVCHHMCTACEKKTSQGCR